jgi:hypothetical protein
MKILGLIKIAKRLFGAFTKGDDMAKTDVVAAGVAAIQAGEVQVYTDQLGLAYDGGFTDGVASVPASTGGVDQSVVDGLNAQVADLQSKLDGMTAQDASDVQAGKDALAALQVSFDKMSADKAVEDGVIAGLQAAKDQLVAVLASLSSIGAPAPVDPAA